jgi:hypothetical protein
MRGRAVALYPTSLAILPYVRLFFRFLYTSVVKDTTSKTKRPALFSKQRSMVAFEYFSMLPEKTLSRRTQSPQFSTSSFSSLFVRVYKRRIISDLSFFVCEIQQQQQDIFCTPILKDVTSEKDEMEYNGFTSVVSYTTKDHIKDIIIQDKETAHF